MRWWHAGLCAVLVAAALGAEVPANGGGTGGARPAADQPLYRTPRNVGELKAVEAAVLAVLPKLQAATVAVYTRDSGQGSGVIVSADGYVMTAGHMTVRPEQPALVRLASGQFVQAVTLGVNADMDSGLMKITTPGEYAFVPRGKSSALRLGQWVLTLGHPGGVRHDRPAPVRLGRVLTMAPRYVATDCIVAPGDSGGPVCTLAGEVVGITSRVGEEAQANLHVPVDTFNQTWERLVKGETWGDTLTGPAGARHPLEGFAYSAENSRFSEDLRTAFVPVVRDVARSTVVVRSADRPVALGLIVDADATQGWLVTKASELGDHLNVRFRDGKSALGQVVGVSEAQDLALVKVTARGLLAAELATDTEPPVGSWVATSTTIDKPLALGIISVGVRRIGPEMVMLGLTLEDTDGGCKVIQVLPRSPAEKAGLRAGDILRQIAGEAAATRAEVQVLMRSHKAGEPIAVQVEREGKSLTFTATPEEASALMTSTHPAPPQLVPLSHRHSGFSAVLTHDTILRPNECGGPLIDLDGRVVGLNIARATRTETYALPAALVAKVVAELRAAPATLPAK